VKDLLTGMVSHGDEVSISEDLGLIDAKPLRDLSSILLGLFIILANMTHPIMCRRATDQVKEISGHAGQPRPATHVPRDVSPRSVDRGVPAVSSARLIERALQVLPQDSPARRPQGSGQRPPSHRIRA
jgi:hypothetical protein